MQFPPFLQLTIHIRFSEDTKLPMHLYSAFRGAFGHALKQVSCLQLNGECHSCRARFECPYSYIFETPVKAEETFYQGQQYSSHPFIIDPPKWVKTFQQDVEYSFQITLFGKALEHWKNIIKAVLRMGKLGIGEKRVNFEVLSVTSQGNEIWHINSPFHYTLPVENMMKKKDYKTNITIRFTTPTQIKINSQLIKNPSFTDLARLIIRRTKALAYYHTDNFVDFDTEELLAVSREIQIKTINTDWIHFDRISNRQKSKMKVKAMIGSIDYEGDVHQFEKLLAFAEIAHIGKKTAFGFGKIKID